MTTDIIVIRVSEPNGGGYGEAVVMEMSETIQICVQLDNGQHLCFESEAYHIRSWAHDNGLKVVTYNILLDLERRCVALWSESP